MTKEEFLNTYGFFLSKKEIDNLDDKDIQYLEKATDILIPCAWEDVGNTKETAVPINCVHNEYIALTLAYIKYKRVRQALYEDKETNKYYDVITIKIMKNKEIQVWFDINDFYPKVYEELLD